MFEFISDQLKKARKIVFLTGAGLSQESGLQTFRGTDGLWRQYDPTKLATPEAFQQDPKLVWEWYYERRRKVLSARPNAGHASIAEIEKYRDTSIVTQNIDGLHHSAGSSNVIELHGNIFMVKCVGCDFRGSIDDRFPEPPPRCEKCGNLLRPSVVWFGEPLPAEAWRSAVEQSVGCDVMVIVGSSLAVGPANTLPLHAKQSGALLIAINPEDTKFTEIMDLYVRSTAAQALPKLADVFK